MKITILFFTLLLFISSGCNGDRCDPEMTSGTWIEGKNIAISFDSVYQRNNYSTIDGPFLLFRYYRLGPMCDNVTDEDWVENLFFAVPDSLDQFKYVDSLIIATNCYYLESGAWFSNRQSVHKGIIEGNKIAIDKWQVRVDVEFNADDRFPLGTQKSLKFEHVFVR